VSVHTDGATGIVEVRALDRDPEPQVRAGHGRSVRHERVENVATRRDEPVDPGAGFHRAGDRLVRGGERYLAQRRGTAAEDRIEQSPTAQLHHAGPGELMRRQRVARQGVPVDQDNVVSLPCQ
jgi:hypothetical protein